MGNKPSVKAHMENAQRTGVFQLQSSKLEEIPVELFRLKSLRTIDFSNNKLKYLPKEFGQFLALKTLLLKNNQLSQLPDEFCCLRKLETLSLENNSLFSLPPAFDALKSLRSINLSNNKLEQFPRQIITLPNLDFVDLSHNSITTVPDGVSQLSVMELNLNQNKISILSDDLADCPRLKVLRAEENCLALEEVTRKILGHSQISTLAIEGNMFELKRLHDHPDYELYQERYTASKKKFT